MDIFAQLDQYLGREYSPDYWADDANLHARELVKQLTQSDWNTLATNWRARNAHWQRYCAEILNWGDPARAVPILTGMAESSDDETVIAAADSLRALYDDGFKSPLPLATERRIREVAKAHPGLAARIINLLLTRAAESSSN